MAGQPASPRTSHLFLTDQVIRFQDRNARTGRKEAKATASIRRHPRHVAAEVAPLVIVERGRSAVPAEAALVAILRYERHLARELRDAMDALERLQAKRRRRRAG